MEHFGDVGSLEDNLESFLSQDDGDGRDLFGTLKPNPSEHADAANFPTRRYFTKLFPV